MLRTYLTLVIRSCVIVAFILLTFLSYTEITIVPNPDLFFTNSIFDSIKFNTFFVSMLNVL